MGKFGMCSCFAATPTTDDDDSKVKAKAKAKPTPAAAVAPDAGAAVVKETKKKAAGRSEEMARKKKEEQTGVLALPCVAEPEDDEMNYTALLRPASRLTAKEKFASLRRNRSASR
jgi:hypothetical protein